MGAANVDNDSADITWALGPATSLVSAGYLLLETNTPSWDLAKRISLQMPFYRTNVSVITDSGGIRQVYVPSGLVDIVTSNDYQYSLNFYYATNSTTTPGTNGLYGTSGTPYDSWIILNPDGSSTNNRLWVTELPSAGGSRQFQYSYNPTNSEWDLLKPDGQTLSTWNIVSAGNPYETNYVRQVSVAGNVVSMNQSTYIYYPDTGRKLIETNIDGYGGNTRTSTYSYYSSGPAYNRLQSVYYFDGKWKYCTYDGLGRLVNEYSSFGTNTPPCGGGVPDPTVTPCKLTVTSYSLTNAVDGADDSGDSSNPMALRKKVVFLPVLSGGAWQLQEVSRTYYNSSYSSGWNEVRQYKDPGALYTDTPDSDTITYYQITQYQGQQTTQVVNPNGTEDYYYYPDDNTTIVYRGSGTTDTTIVDDWGHIMSHTNIDTASGVVLSRELYCYTNTTGDYIDPLRRSYTVTDLAGRVTVYNYNCCNLESTTDPDGVGTEYGYDILKHRTSTTVYYSGSGPGITTTNSLDALGRILQTVRIGTDGSVITNMQMEYDVLGNLVEQTNALGGVTGTTNVIIGGKQVVTNLFDDGSVQILSYNYDGTVQSVTGTAVHSIRYEYGAEQDGGYYRSFVKEIDLNPDGSDTSEWTKKYTDGMGRSYKTAYPSSSGLGPFSEHFYNAKGQLSMSVDPDKVATIYQYNSNGQLEYTAVSLDSSDTNLDSDGNGSVDYSTDRIRQTERTVVAATGGLPDMVQINNYVWNGGQVLVNSQENSADGLQSWNIQYANAYTSITNYTQISYGSNSRTQMMIAPDGSYGVSVFNYGQIASKVYYDSGGNQIGSTTYGYDAHGRTVTTTDARNGTTTYGFNNADLVATNTTPSSGTGSPEVTVTTYDKLLRAVAMIQPDLTVVSNIYLPTGELGFQFGSRNYPVGYGYDYAGRMQTMTNWSNFSGGTGARITTWIYDGQRGWLTNKVYADNKGPNYTYTSAGRLFTRIWARGVITTNLYDMAGDLTNVSYSDSTPAVNYTYDQMGRQGTVAMNGITDTLSYDLHNDLLGESYSGGILDGLAVTNVYDQCLRRTNLTAFSAGSPLLSDEYGYDNASRLASVTDASGNAATYSYLANSPLVSQITFKQSGTTRMTTTKQYDYLNRLTQISSVPSVSGVLPLTYNYSYNSANQRSQDTLADGSYWTYGYDSLGQVTNGCKHFAGGMLVAGQQFGYAFDTIGNRTLTLAGGDTNGGSLRLANYQANSLNQVTNRDVPPYVDIMGASILTNTVIVNGQTASRNQEYFRQQVLVNNTNSALWTNIIVSGGQSVTGNLYVAQEPETFKYDADGNLTNDGRWAYTWDGENRLIQMTVNTNVGPLFQLTFAYDAKGRRIQKAVATNSVGVYTNNFLYDGWNLVVELTPGNALIRNYLWGNDLSGSLQGAGGVGGLLEFTCSNGTGNTNCFSAFDGNGNIAGLINSADGKVLADYEYGPFGEVIRTTGPMAKANPMRFSTKYQDDESDLVYYGYRYYKPSTGTWVSRDPADEDGGLNLYGFLQNASLDSIDKLGLSGFSLKKQSGVAVITASIDVDTEMKGNCTILKVKYDLGADFGIGAGWSATYNPTKNDKVKVELQGMVGLDGAHTTGEYDKDFCGCCSKFSGDILNLSAGFYANGSAKATWTHGDPDKWNGREITVGASAKASVAIHVPVHLTYDSCVQPNIRKVKIGLASDTQLDINVFGWKWTPTWGDPNDVMWSPDWNF